MTFNTERLPVLH